MPKRAANPVSALVGRARIASINKTLPTTRFPARCSQVNLVILFLKLTALV